MDGHIYKQVQLVGTSPKSIEDAVQRALTKASESLRNIRWVEMIETRGAVSNGQVAEWQVTIKAAFTVE